MENYSYGTSDNGTDRVRANGGASSREHRWLVVDLCVQVGFLDNPLYRMDIQKRCSRVDRTEIWERNSLKGCTQYPGSSSRKAIDYPPDYVASERSRASRMGNFGPAIGCIEGPPRSSYKAEQLFGPALQPGQVAKGHVASSEPKSSALLTGRQTFLVVQLANCHARRYTKTDPGFQARRNRVCQLRTSP